MERVVTKPEASATYTATRFGYAFNGRAVTHVVGEQWDDDGQTSCFPLHTHGYVNTYGWEYRYDGSRARYAARGLDPDRLYMVVNPLGGWSDYDGDEIYDDYYVNASGLPTTTRRFEPGIGRTDYTGSAYYHADHLGTIRGLTNASATWGEAMAFTAFGERKVGTQDSYSRRYGYVGSFGYQASGEYPFLHVGARYYDPATGRFLQRDPIGIRGGRNVYAYVRNSPVAYLDPEGLYDLGDAVKGVVSGVLTAIVCEAAWPAVVASGVIGLIWGLEDSDFPQPVNDDTALDISVVPPPQQPPFPPPIKPEPVFERPWWERLPGG